MPLKGYIASLTGALLLLFCGWLGAEDLIFGTPLETDMIFSRSGFALGYSHTYRQALWVSYILSAENLTGRRYRRSGSFMADPEIKVKPVHPRDYRKTGYDRGHLAPAADMRYAEAPMKHSFFMSNISPQIPGCNRGIWKRLEKQTRKWALKEKKLCVVTGPVFLPGEKQLTRTGLPVPNGFYKVILDMTPPRKMIAFVIPNAASRKRLKSFVVSVDHVEKMTGCDFFSSLPDREEERLERRSDLKKWSLH